MNKRLFILAMVVLFISILFGCAKTGTKTASSLNPDGTVGKVEWGMTADEIRKIIGPEVKELANGTLMLENFSLLGESTTVLFEFEKMGLEIPEARLVTINITFPESVEMSELVEKISTVFGAKEALPQEFQYWHSAQSLMDVLNETKKAEARSIAEKSLGKELNDSDYNQWLSDQWLFTAVLDNVPFSEVKKSMYIHAYGSLLAQVLKEQ